MSKKEQKSQAQRERETFHLFVNARSFQIAARAIGVYEKCRNLLMWPNLVNEAFALELHIKCLLEVRRIFKRGHNVKDLYYELHGDDRAIIEAKLQDILEKHPLFAQAVEEGIPTDVDSILLRTSDLFVKGRYWHEGLELPKDASGFHANVGTASLSDAISRLIIEIKPTWANQVARFQWPLMQNTKLRGNLSARQREKPGN